MQELEILIEELELNVNSDVDKNRLLERLYEIEVELKSRGL